MSEAEKAVPVEDVLSSIRRLVANSPQPVSLTLKPSDAEPQRDEPEDETPDVAVQANEDEPPQKTVGFIDTINASIAEITQDAEVETAADEAVSEEEATLDVPETRTTHVDTFLTNETVIPLETVPAINLAPKKPEPFILHANMAAEKIQAEAPVIKTKEPELVLRDEDAAQAEYEAASESIPEDDMLFSEGNDEEAEDTTTPDTNEQFIDEDILREIVSEMVRDELQGDLGDRITRNVRKLVRREIHHALATQDFS